MSLSIRHSFDENDKRIGTDPARVEARKRSKARRAREASAPEPIVISTPDYVPSADYRSPDSEPFHASAFLDLSHVDKLGTIRKARMLAKLFKRKHVKAERASLCLSDVKHARARAAYLATVQTAVNARTRAMLHAQAYARKFKR